MTSRDSYPIPGSDLHVRWERLDPVLIRGMQRSGTSILYRVLTDSGLVGFPEGHLWDELVETLAHLRDPAYLRGVRLSQPGFALGEGRRLEFERQIAVSIDEYHRRMLGATDSRWFDKSPGDYSIRLVPMLLELFPESQVLFIYRNGVTVVHSGMRLWAERRPDVFGELCRGWVDTMNVWRRIRGLLGGRFLEIAQERVVAEPEAVARDLAEFLHLEPHADAIADRFATHRENTAFRDRAPGDYRYEIRFSAEQREYFAATCGREMAAWGYELDFEEPTAPSSSVVPTHPEGLESLRDYYSWVGVGKGIPLHGECAEALARADLRIESLAAELQRLRSGRVLRLLLAGESLLRRMGFR